MNQRQQSIFNKKSIALYAEYLKEKELTESCNDNDVVPIPPSLILALLNLTIKIEQ